MKMCAREGTVEKRGDCRGDCREALEFLQLLHPAQLVDELNCIGYPPPLFNLTCASSPHPSLFTLIWVVTATQLVPCTADCIIPCTLGAYVAAGPV